jgi:hypothetical protein
MRTGPRTTTWLLAVALCALAAPGCGRLHALRPPEEPEPEEPAMAVHAPAPVQAQAKTTLLEDNEELRDRLVRALGEKRTLEKELMEAKDSVTTLQTQVTEREDSIASLSEQIQKQQAELERLEAIRTQLDKDRQTIAEMYALEKRQRLAFEKELLEREIAERTHSREEP